jgi:RNA polymerase sigma-70 factor (ECF subfamily)
MLSNEADSEDAVQEALCRLVAKQSALAQSDAAESGDPGRPSWTQPELAAIFFTTLRNLCVDKLRRKRPRSNMAAEEWIESVPSAEGHAIAKETRQQIEKSLSQLPENWRQALVLRSAFELNYDEISQVMHSTRAQIRTWIFRARQQLSCDLKLKDRT